MKQLKKLLGETITDAAREHKVKFFKKWARPEDEYFYKHLEELLTSYVKSECSKHRVGALASTSQPKDMFFSTNPEISELKQIHDVILEFRAEQMRDHGQMIYPKEGWSVFSDTHGDYLSILKEECDKQSLLLEQTYAECNYWDWDTMRREFTSKYVYRMKTKDGSWLSFEEPKKEETCIHILMFETLGEHHGNYLFTLREFSKFFSALLCSDSIVSVQSPCLGGPEDDTSQSRIKQKDATNCIASAGDCTDWRFQKMNLGGRFEETFRLMVMWHRQGGINVRIEGQNPDAIYFFKFDDALEVKEMFLTEGKENPYRLISTKSIYTREQALELKSS